MAGRNVALFPEEEQGTYQRGERYRPLPDRIRPVEWSEFEGLAALDAILVSQLQRGTGKPPSLVLWGAPGTGKTTFAKLMGKSFNFPFVEFSAVLGGVKEIRDIIADAKRNALPTILFLDEIHRFNKGQQDALLPHVEDGTIILVGATTENPSFYLNAALLSRCKVVVFPDLSNEAMRRIIERACERVNLSFEEAATALLVQHATGDARRVINLIEALAESRIEPANAAISEEALKSYLSSAKVLFHDRSGEEHYNVVSAFIKSLRGSDPDAALYWGFRMIEAGEDPLFVIRRMIIFASEDIGNADPRALSLAVATCEAFERIGLPEGKIPIAQCITYLASAPKSNRSYVAMHAAANAVASSSKVAVPLHLRNAPTKLMKGLGYGSNYQYPHDHKGAHVSNVNYLPDEVAGNRFYEPSDRGYEKVIGERLRLLKEVREK